MSTLIAGALTLFAGLLVIPATVVFVEIVAAILLPLRRRGERAGGDRRGPVAVLVPAHNESRGIVPTLEDIRGQLRPVDRLVVVADNCSDDTASVAAAFGAEVICRDDPARLGKGYALDFGLRHLDADPPETVIIIDADCRLAPGAIDVLAANCACIRRPVQAHYLMAAPAGSAVNFQVAEFAWRVKNWLRPLGLSALGLPCQLHGTGMAFPWSVIRSANLASGEIVEDLKLGLDLADMGYPARFCPDAVVTSEFASSAAGAASQRRRWEGGHARLILTTAPRLVAGAIAARNWGLLALALDLAVPPLALLVVLVFATAAAAALLSILDGSNAALALSTVSMAAILVATSLAWLKCGRHVLPLRAIGSIAPYVLGKLKLHVHILLDRRDARWIRTDRTHLK